MHCAYVIQPAQFAEFDGEIFQTAVKVTCDQPALLGGFCAVHLPAAQENAIAVKRSLAAPANGAGSLPAVIYHRKRGMT